MPAAVPSLTAPPAIARAVAGWHQTSGGAGSGFFGAERDTQSDPTQEQIAAECKLIQAMWSDAERVGRMRVDWRPIGWEVRLVAAADDAVTAGGRTDRRTGSVRC